MHWCENESEKIARLPAWDWKEGAAIGGDGEDVGETR